MRVRLALFNARFPEADAPDRDRGSSAVHQRTRGAARATRQHHCSRKPRCHHAQVREISRWPVSVQPSQCLMTAHHQQVSRCVTTLEGSLGRLR
jgi:hypothetical protein